jgi:hypothetical protein
MLISFFFNHYRVIVACCVLHKIALDRNQYLEEDELANVDLICDEDQIKLVELPPSNSRSTSTNMYMTTHTWNHQFSMEILHFCR